MADPTRPWRLLRRLGLTVAVALGAVAIATPAAAGPPPAAAAGRSLRVLAYNTGFLWVDLPGLCGSIDINDGKYDDGASYPERASDIADAILATDNDIVILEEVFSDPVKDILVSKLQSEYPTYIKKISKAQTLEIANPLLIGLLGAPGAACADVLSLSNTTSFTSADSGLMIFVKKGLNFVPFTQPAPYDVATVTGSNQGVPWGGPGQIAVDTFEFDPTLGVLEAGECYLEDCLSSKAVAMVRVANPVSGDVHNIAFSHLQAWYEPDQVAVREKQFAIAKDLFTSSLTPAQLTSQPSFYTGDLNVPGENEVTATAGSEWSKLFNSSDSSSGNFFACGEGPCTFSASNPGGSLLTDSWGFQTSPDDGGMTNFDDKMRLDYFLHNLNLPSLSSRYCVQHVMRAYDLDDPVQLSDHIGIRVDINRKTPHCSANDDAGAAGPTPIAFDVKGNHATSSTIAGPGGMYWLRLDETAGWGTGSYIFSVKSNTSGFRVAMDVYQSTDLSTPLPSFLEDPSGRWTQFSLPDPPYYIRIFAVDAAGRPDRTKSGAFTFTAHENRGVTPGDAIAMRPGGDHHYPWPALSQNGSAQQDNVTFLPDTQVWHTFFTDTATSGNFPEVTFLSENDLNLDPGLDAPPFSMTVRDADAGHTPLGDKLDQWEETTQYHDYDVDGWRDYRLLAPDLPGTGAGPKQYYMTVQRNASAWNENIESTTTFRTTLTFIKSLQLTIDEEVTWGPAADSSTFRWSYDAGWTDGKCTTIKWLVCYGPRELDDGDVVHPHSWDSSFNGSFTQALAPDVWEDGDWLSMLGAGSIQPMSANVADPITDSFSWRNTYSDDYDYWYILDYCLAHEREVVDTCKLTG